MTKFTRFVVIPALLLCVGLVSAQEVWVDINTCPAIGTGTPADPYCSVQDAICDIKSTGGTVRVSPGQYFEALRIFPGVSVVSTDGPSVTSIAAAGRPCINQDCTDSTTELQCSSVIMSAVMGVPLTPADRLEGFTIGGGSGIVRDFTEGVEATVGGGIFVFNSSPTITNNVINANNVIVVDPTIEFARGGGIYIQSSELQLNPVAVPVITNNEIVNNATDTPAGADQYNFKFALGGGIYIGTWAAPIIEDNTIRNNQVGLDTTSYQLGAGGGVSIYTLSTAGLAPTLSRNLIEFNYAADFGGGIYAGFSEDAFMIDRPSVGTVENSVFQYNDAVLGGAVGIKYSNVKFRNNTMVDNTAGYGGAIYAGFTYNNQQSTIVNNVISYNSGYTAGRGGGLYVYQSDPIVRYNDFWQNTSEDIAGEKSDIDYIGIDGNFKADPEFVNRGMTSRNLRTVFGSAIVDVGDNAEASSLDLDGAPRVQDGFEDGNLQIDLGAYEYPSDFDDDGIVDWQDPDDDNDGVDDPLDCHDMSASISSLPSDLGNSLHVDYGPVDSTLSWAASLIQGRTYNVYRGTFTASTSWVYNETCFVTETLNTTAEDPSIPAADEGFYFLVSAKNLCGETRAGVDGNGVDHFPASACVTAGNDFDADGVLDLEDNCTNDANTDQADSDLDFVGNVCDVCPNDAFNDQDMDGLCADLDSDDDGDGVGDAIDCNPNDPGATDNPGAVTTVRFSYASGATLTWDAQTGVGTATGYDIAGNDIASLQLDSGSVNAVCFEDDFNSNQWIDTQGVPANDSGFYYIIRAQNSCGDGGYGTETGGAERIPTGACP